MTAPTATTVYQPGQNGDTELLHWYTQLVTSGDLAKLLGPSVHPTAAFLRHFTEPNALVFYEGDARGWWGVSWAFPFIGGGTWGLWLREDKRHHGSRHVLGFVLETLHFALQMYPVLVNTTTQAAVVAKTKRLGYTYLGCVPYLFEGQDCHVLHITRDAFAPIYEKWRNTYERRVQ